MYARSSGLGADQTQLTALQQTLHNLALSIDLAKRTGQTDAAAALQEQYARVAAQVRALTTELYASETPGTIMQTLDRFSTWASDTIAKFTGGVAELPGAAGKALPLVALAAIGIAALVYLPRPKRRAT